MSNTSLVSQREALMVKAQGMLSDTHGRSMTADERAKLSSITEQVKSIDQQIAGAKRDQDLFNQFNSQTREDEPGTKSYRGSLRDVTAKMVNRSLVSSLGTKSLVDAINVDVPVIASTPVAQGMPASSVWDIIPMVKQSHLFQYLRQITRENNAAPVAVGAKKPTSIYTLTKVEGRLKVIAHLSEPVDKYMLADNSSLEGFLQGELAYGIYLALEEQLFNGDGLGENFTGLNSTSGIQTQAFATSRLLTTRKAITKVETLAGDIGGAFVFSPLDWEDIETSTSTTGEYLLGDQVPVDRAARRLWGKPVSTCLAVPTGTAWYIGEGAAELASDMKLDLGWGLSGDDFERNQVRARLETRADLMVKRPSSIVKVSLTA